MRSRKSFRKEDRVKEILVKRGEQPGVVCILSAKERCGSYKPWHDKKAPCVSVSLRSSLPDCDNPTGGKTAGATALPHQFRFVHAGTAGFLALQGKPLHLFLLLERH